MASKQAKAEGSFELSIGNPDKGMLPLDQVRQRVEQFITAGLPVVVVQVGAAGPANHPASEALPTRSLSYGLLSQLP